MAGALPGLMGLVPAPATPKFEAAGPGDSFRSGRSLNLDQPRWVPAGLEPLRACEKCSEGGGYKALHSKQDPDTFATEMLGWLFLGGAHDAKLEDEIRARQITHVLNLAPEADIPRLSGLQYHTIRVFDHSDQSTRLRPHFEEAIQFLDTARSSGRVLVHCRQGVSRSATVVMAYLMNKVRIPYRLARDIVKRKRPVVNPNVGFVTLLEAYEEELGIDESRPLYEYASNLEQWGLESDMIDPAYDEDAPETPPSPKTATAAFPRFGFGDQ
eukprot:Hpha_TRINITY_DN13299_c0_g1::TRINITY_DN13299_c0_g1_i1::g.155029::m.155029/K04459/DUSP, MKP; dual specificity MAP kinase phosphatase